MGLSLRTSMTAIRLFLNLCVKKTGVPIFSRAPNASP
jgi:hypothetical protein